MHVPYILLGGINTVTKLCRIYQFTKSLMYLGLRASVNTEIRGVYLLKMYRPTKQKFGNLMKFKPTPASDYKFGNNYYVT